MDNFLIPIKTGLLLFPFLALIITAPLALRQYHRYGAITWVRVLVIYSFVYYMMTAYFMVILPLPDPDTVEWTRWQSHVRVVPMNNILAYVGQYGAPHTRSELGDFLKSFTFLQLAFNVLLTVPFGVYMRYYFKRTWYQTLVLSFLLSLFYECTQITGLYWIYPAPYRTFDVDDLICNSLGGLLGFILAPAFVFFLPKREELDEESAKKSRDVSMFRRLWAESVDMLIVSGVVFGIHILQKLTGREEGLLDFGDVYLLAGAFILFSWLCTVAKKGRTPGKMICHIRVAGRDGRSAGFWRLSLRYLLLALELLGIPALSEWAFRYGKTVAESQSRIGGEMLQIIALLSLAIPAVFLVKLLLKLFGRKTQFLYERLSGTWNVSTYAVGIHTRI